jgi:hypothetical protein
MKRLTEMLSLMQVNLRFITSHVYSILANRQIASRNNNIFPAHLYANAYVLYTETHLKAAQYIEPKLTAC